MAHTKNDILPSPQKRVERIGSSRSAVRAFPKEERDEIGRSLFEVQMNRLPPDWKPMRAVGAGVCEIRVHTSVEHGLIYVARFEEAVYVLHAFEKRTQKTQKRDLEIARRRFAEAIRKRQSDRRS